MERIPVLSLGEKRRYMMRGVTLGDLLREAAGLKPILRLNKPMPAWRKIKAKQATYHRGAIKRAKG